MKYNRTEAAMTLLSEIDAWCQRTATREGVIGHVLFLHPGFVGLLRLRHTVTVEKEIAVRQFIYHDHPNGWSGELPKTHGNGTRPVADKRAGQVRRSLSAEPVWTKLSDAEIAARRVDRDACPRCGVRADVGCGHSRQPLGTVL